MTTKEKAEVKAITAQIQKHMSRLEVIGGREQTRVDKMDEQHGGAYGPLSVAQHNANVLSSASKQLADIFDILHAEVNYSHVKRGKQ